MEHSITKSVFFFPVGLFFLSCQIVRLSECQAVVLPCFFGVNGNVRRFVPVGEHTLDDT